MPVIAPFLYGINGGVGSTKFISNSLKQMHPESNFIKGLFLNDQAATTRYYVIAGNIQKYQSDNSWWEQFKDKMSILGLQWVYGETPSDLVVSVPQITRLPDSFKAVIIELGCYHTNYFEVAKGQQILLDILGKD